MRPTLSTALFACAATFVLGSTLPAEATGSADAQNASEPVAPADTLRPLIAKDTLSVDFPDEDIRAIIHNVGNFFSLELDFPQHIQGRTSLKLRDVTWRQIFKVVLAPVGYDFYERDGVVIIRAKEEIDALPPITQAVKIHNQVPKELVAVLNETLGDIAAFSAADRSLVYRAHPRYVSNVEAVIASYDSPEVRLNPFPIEIYFPDKLPDLEPAPNRVFYLNGKPGGDLFTTQVFILKHIGAAAAARRLGKELNGKESRVLPGRRVNALIVTAAESVMPRLEAMITYLDDKCWYDPASARAQEAATPENPTEAADLTAKPASP